MVFVHTEQPVASIPIENVEHGTGVDVGIQDISPVISGIVVQAGAEVIVTHHCAIIIVAMVEHVFVLTPVTVQYITQDHIAKSKSHVLESRWSFSSFLTCPEA